MVLPLCSKTYPFAITISIHPMLWFFKSSFFPQIKHTPISIHPMLWFFICSTLPFSSLSYDFNTSNVMVLRGAQGHYAKNSRNFNTSNVMVLLPAKNNKVTSKVFQYIQCYGSSELRFMLNSRELLFQYIQCYGSSRVAVIDLGGRNNFNTSNVMVLLGGALQNGSAWALFQYIQCYGSSR